MQLKRRILSLVAAGGLSFAGLAMVPAQHAFAGSGWSPACTDGGDTEVPIITSPVTIGVEVGSTANPLLGHVGICYSTTPNGYTGPETAGGLISANFNPNPSTAGVGVDSFSDPSAAVQVNSSTLVTPSYTIQPGGGNGGQVLTVTIPFKACVGQCSYPNVNTTGVIIGTISQPSAGGANAAYGLSSVCVMVDGIALTNCNAFLGNNGVTTTGTSPTNISSQGPCSLNVCLPIFGSSYVGTTGNQLATIYVADIRIPVYGVHTCVYQASVGTPCPY